MSHVPDRLRFGELARSPDHEGGAAPRLVPVYRRLYADSLTPLSAFARIDGGDAACLFESVVGGEKVGRYSFLGADPFLRMEARGTAVRITGPAGSEDFTCPDPLAELERRMAAYRPARLPELPPFTSGAVGYAAYDTVRYTERLPAAPADDLHLPDLSFAFYDRMVVFDNVTKAFDVVVLARGWMPRSHSCRHPRPGRLPPTSVRAMSPAVWPTARHGRRSRARHFWRRSTGPSNTSVPATCSRWCSAGGWRSRSRLRRSNSTARSGS
jgi:hypothetical protein